MRKLFFKDSSYTINQIENAYKENPSVSAKYNSEITFSSNKYLGIGVSVNYNKNSANATYSSEVTPINLLIASNNLTESGLVNAGIEANYTQTINKDTKVFFSNLASFTQSSYSLVSEDQRQQFRNENTTKALEYTSQIDYETLTKSKVKIEAGGKYLYRYYSVLPIYDSEQGVSLNYNQSIYGGYLSGSKTTKKIFFRLGMRAEGTRNSYDNVKIQAVNILPNALVSVNYSKNSLVRLFYRRNVKRPSINRLTVFIDQQIPLNTVQGNPNLENEVFDILDLQSSWTIKNTSISATLSNTWGNNIVNSRKLVTGYNTGVVYDNFSTSRVSGVGFSFNSRLLKNKLFVSASGNLRYYKILSSL